MASTDQRQWKSHLCRNANERSAYHFRGGSIPIFSTRPERLDSPVSILFISSSPILLTWKPAVHQQMVLTAIIGRC